MAETPDVKRFYFRLAILLGAGALAGLTLWLTAEPGAGSISVGGAVIGSWIASLAYTAVLGATLYFMGRVATVIAANGGPVSTNRYSTLSMTLLAGMALAGILTFFANPSLSNPQIGALLLGGGIALGTLTLVMVAFLGFMRNLVAHSDLQDAPSVGKLYLGLIALGGIGALLGAIVLGTANPGSGPFNVSAAAIGFGLATLTHVGTTMALLIYLGATVKDAVQTAQNPARGNAIPVAQGNGASSDPNVTFSSVPDTLPASDLSRVGGRKVIEVEGIGPVYERRLKESLNIETFAGLFAADAHEVAQAIGTTTQQVQEWQQMIHLMDVKGIGPQYSEMLVKAGIRSPSQLAAADGLQLLKTIDTIEQGRKSRVLKVNVEEGMVKRFIQLAKDHDE